jgi:hypothetical protein
MKSLFFVGQAHIVQELFATETPSHGVLWFFFSVFSPICLANRTDQQGWAEAHV